MKKTSRAFASRLGLLAVVVCGCAQVLGVEGWTDTGAGGHGGEQASSSTTAAQSTVGSSSASAGGQSTVGSSSASAGGQSTVGSSSASAGGQSTVGSSSAVTVSSSAGTGGQTSASSTGAVPCLPDGMTCQDPTQCCSQTCNAGVCSGCLGLGTACAGGGCCQDLICGNPWKCCVHAGPCSSNADCCSGSCFGTTCGIQCADETEACAAHSECCPGLVCKSTVCASDCAAQGDSCSTNADCCVDLRCEGGTCVATCSGLWKSCNGNAECCPGLMCPAGLCTPYPMGQYESESNGDMFKANKVFPGKVCGAISSAGDNDWFRIVLPGGVGLAATVGPGAGGNCAPGGTIDSEVEIRIPSTTLAFNDDLSGMNYCSGAATAITVPGTYFVRVAASQAKAPAATFSYCLTLTVSP